MSPTVLPTAPRKAHGLQGRHVLAVFLAFFAAVFVANGAMIYSALSTHTGLVANEPYRKGLHYNERIAADARQAQLGWVETIEVTRDGHVSLALAQADGRPVGSLKIVGVLGRPSTNRHDVQLALAEKAPGRYEAQVQPLAEGNWIVALEAFAGRTRPSPSTARGGACGSSRNAHRVFRPTTEAAIACVSRRSTQPRSLATTTLVVENMHCGGCMRKVEAALAGVPGVTSARANLSARRATAVHGDAGVNSADLVDALARAGFKAAELADEAASEPQAGDKDFFKRLGVAGFAAANIMLLSVSVWSAGGDMLPSVQALFHWLSALIALPAVAYAGQPFFRSAAQALRARRLNMDVPISLGVSLATLMSLYQTTRGSEQVYFDAAVTLLFFLLVGRFLDQRMRTRAAGAAANLLGLRGTAATVLQADGTSVRMSARAARARHAHRHGGGRALRRRRPRRGGPRRGRRQPDHRRDDAARGGARRRRLRRHDQPVGRAGDAGHGHRPEHAAGRDRPPDDRRRAGARALRAPRRPRGAALRAGRAHLGRRHVPGLARRGSGLGDGTDGRHRRADHHLPLRAGAGGAGGAGRRHQPAVRAAACW